MMMDQIIELSSDDEEDGPGKYSDVIIVLSDDEEERVSVNKALSQRQTRGRAEFQLTVKSESENTTCCTAVKTEVDADIDMNSYKISSTKLQKLRIQVKGMNLGGNFHNGGSPLRETQKHEPQHSHTSPDSAGDSLNNFNISDSELSTNLNNAATRSFTDVFNSHEEESCTSSCNSAFPVEQASSSVEPSVSTTNGALSVHDQVSSSLDQLPEDEYKQPTEEKKNPSWSFLQPCTSTSFPSPKKKQFPRSPKIKAENDLTSSPKKKPLLDFMASHMKVDDSQLFPFTPPLHVLPPKEKVYRSTVQCRGKRSNKPIVFTNLQLSSLDSLKEEGFYKAYLVEMMSFIGRFRKPPLDHIQFVVSHILLKSKNKALSLEAYRTLKHIHTMFPVFVRGVFSANSEVEGWNWEFISEIVDMMEISGCSHQDYSKDGICLASFNASLALLFILSVLEEEAKCYTQGGKKPIVAKLLSPQFAKFNVEDVTSWLKIAMSHHGAWCFSHTICKPIFSDSDADSSNTVTYKLTDLPCSVSLIQRFLQLTFFIGGTNYIETIATDLLYVFTRLPVERRVLFLQSIESHQLRKTLIQLIIENHCKSREDGSVQSSGQPLSIHKIVKYFKTKVPIRHTICDGDEEFWSRTAEEYEEFVTLLVYLMQSYIFTVHEHMQGIQKRVSVDKECPSRHLSLDDKGILANIEKHVNKITDELFQYLPCPTEKTLFLLELMNSFKCYAF